MYFQEPEKLSLINAIQKLIAGESAFKAQLKNGRVVRGVFWHFDYEKKILRYFVGDEVFDGVKKPEELETLKLRQAKALRQQDIRYVKILTPDVLIKEYDHLMTILEDIDEIVEVAKKFQKDTG